MLSVHGTFSGGVAKPDDIVDGRDGQRVVITFVRDLDQPEPPSEDGSRNDLVALIEECQMSTGISDLAHQHDHYVHGTPKRTD